MEKLDLVGNIFIAIIALAGVVFAVMHILKRRLKHKTMIDNIFTIIVIVGLIFFGTQHRRGRHAYNNKLLQQASYSIGEVSFYRSGRSPLVVPKIVNSTGRTPAIGYHFTLNGETISNKYDAYKADVPTDGVKDGEKYLVLYKKDNPAENRMFFKYPIKDSTDFKRYVKEFEQMRKQKK